MLLGFNTNFRHRGVLFHVQTEDSGRANPHVITHLFHGGNILASQKCDYSEKLDAPDFELEVKTLMETQHKAMLKGLKAGLHDPIILQRLGESVFDEALADAVDPSREVGIEGDPGATAPAPLADVLSAGPQSAAPDTSGSTTASTAPNPQAVSPAGAGPDGAPRVSPQPDPTSSDASSDSPSDSPSDKERIQRAFGEGVVSQKPLDEVVLEYLVESARKRKRSST